MRNNYEIDQYQDRDNDQDTGFLSLFNPVYVPQQHRRELSQVEKMREEIRRSFHFVGLSVSLGYVQYSGRSIAVSISIIGNGNFFADSATTALRRVRQILTETIGRNVTIAVDGRDGTVWIEAEGG